MYKHNKYNKYNKNYSQTAILHTPINCILIQNKNIKNIILNISNIDTILIDDLSLRISKLDAFYLIYKSNIIKFFENDDNDYIIKIYCKDVINHKLEPLNTFDKIFSDNNTKTYIFSLKKYAKEKDEETWHNININDWKNISTILNIPDISLSINNTFDIEEKEESVISDQSEYESDSYDSDVESSSNEKFITKDINQIIEKVEKHEINSIKNNQDNSDDDNDLDSNSDSDSDSETESNTHSDSDTQSIIDEESSIEADLDIIEDDEEDIIDEPPADDDDDYNTVNKTKNKDKMKECFILPLKKSKPTDIIELSKTNELELELENYTDTDSD